MRSVKFDIAFDAADLFEPGETLILEFQTRTTPTELLDSDYPIAWNTTSTGGSAISGEGEIGALATVVVPATEGRKVGIAYPTGPVQLEKIVTGPGADFAPEEFTIQLTCTSVGAEILAIPESTVVVGEDPITVDGLPWGAECTATESDQGQSDVEFGTAVVGGPNDEIGLVTVDNVFQVGGLQITKDVDSDAVDEDGVAVEYGPFEVSVTCEFLGEEVFAAGFGPENPMTAVIADGETAGFTGLPTGATCEIAETDAADAVSTTITPTTVTIGEGGTAVVEIVNGYDVGSIALEKVVDGAGAEDFGAGPFTMHVTCVLDDASGVRTVYDADVVLGGDEPLETQIDDLASGAECTVSEPDPAGAQEVGIEPETVTVGTGEPVDVTVTNTFLAGSLTVTKQVEGDGAELYGAGPFEVTIACTREGVDGPVDLPIPGGASRELTADNGYEATYEPLLVGSTCTIDETMTGGANSTQIVDDAGNPITTVEIAGADAPVEVIAVNTFDLGFITVEKLLTGGGADAATGPFTVSLACVREVDGTATPVEIPGGAERVLSRAGGLTVEYDDLPTGAECTLTETDAGGAASTTITPNDGDPAVGIVTVADGEGVALTVENTFDPPLPGTGTQPGPWVLLAAGLVLGGGLVLVFARRGRRPSES